MDESSTKIRTEGTALRSLLDDATALATGFLEGLPERRVTPTATAGGLREELGGPLPDGPRDSREERRARAHGHAGRAVLRLRHRR